MPSWLTTGSRLRALLRTPGVLQVVGIAVLVIVAEVVAVGILTGAFSSHGSAGPENAGPRLARLTEANPHAVPQHAAGSAVVNLARATPARTAHPAPAVAPTPAPTTPAPTHHLRHVNHAQPKHRSQAPQAPSQPAPRQPAPQRVSQPAPFEHFHHHRDRQTPGPNVHLPQQQQQQQQDGDGGDLHQGEGGGDQYRGDLGRGQDDAGDNR
jgi:hypothetical protein